MSVRKYSIPNCCIMFCLAASALQAQEVGSRLVEEKLCIACHQMEQASLGPPWRAIAARHAQRTELMTAVLAGKIIRGGGGNWGLVPMVPNQRVSEEEARVMAQWILQQTQN